MVTFLRPLKKHARRRSASKAASSAMHLTNHSFPTHFKPYISLATDRGNKEIKSSNPIYRLNEHWRLGLTYSVFILSHCQIDASFAHIQGGSNNIHGSQCCGEEMLLNYFRRFFSGIEEGGRETWEIDRSGGCLPVVKLKLNCCSPVPIHGWCSTLYTFLS